MHMTIARKVRTGLSKNSPRLFNFQSWESWRLFFESSESFPNLGESWVDRFTAKVDNVYRGESYDKLWEFSLNQSCQVATEFNLQNRHDFLKNRGLGNLLDSGGNFNRWESSRLSKEFWRQTAIYREEFSPSLFQFSCIYRVFKGQSMARKPRNVSVTALCVQLSWSECVCRLLATVSCVFYPNLSLGVKARC